MFKSSAMAAAAAWLLLTASAQAGSLSVSPVTLGFAQGQKAVTATVSNPGEDRVRVQVRLFRWSSAGDGETYTPTGDIGFSPPMFELAAGGRQVVRLMLRSAAPVEREAGYRLIVDQLPEPDKPGLQMPLRMILPVFVSPKSGGSGKLIWSLGTDEDGARVLTATNTGQRRVKLFDLAYADAGGAHVLQPGLAGYVLAGESRTWRVPPGSSDIEVSALTEEGSLKARPSPATK